MTATVTRGVRSGRVPDRVSVLLADQTLNSVTNVLMTILVARQASLAQFGVFATVQLGVSLAQTVAMAAAGDRWLQADEASRPARFAGGLGFFRWGMTGALAVAGCGWWAVGPAAGFAGLAAAPAMAGLDYVRVALFADGRAAEALRMDLAYGLLQVLLLGCWIGADGRHGATGAWLAWGLAAYTVFLPYAMERIRVAAPVRRARRSPVREAVSLRYGAEMMLVNGGGQLAQLIVSARLGVAFNGVFRATQVPFGPLLVLIQASRALLIPAFRAGAGTRLLVSAAAAYTGLCGLCTLLTLVVTGSPSLRVLLGGVEPPTSYVLLTGLLFTTFGLHSLVFYFFRAREWDRSVTVSRAVLVLALALTTAVSAAAGSAALFLALTAANWVIAVLAMAGHRLLLRSRPSPDPGK